MSDLSALFDEMDPGRPLGADEDALYVDWQRELDPDVPDVKSRLARAFARNASPEHPIVRLLTGHKGSGKTTELNRVAGQLRAGMGGRRVFASTLFAQRWLDMEDVQPEDLVLQVVRQLVADLKQAGMSFGEKRFTSWFRSLRDRLKGTRLESASVGLDPLQFSFALDAFPTERDQFREVLRGQLPTVYDIVNRELLPRARTFLRDERHYDDIVLIVDDLDKIPQKVLADERVTNHENLFLDNSAKLRALNCSLLLTIPIELAYSPAQGRLRDDYGSSMFTVPLVSITERDGTPIEVGERALIEVLGRRALRALHGGDGDQLAAAGELFDSAETLTRLVRLSGGHVRSLLVTVTELLTWIDELPITGSLVERYAPRAARDLARALYERDRDILRQVGVDHLAVEDPRFFYLLRNHYVFAYEARSDEYWYGLNPLLKEIGL